MTNDDKELQALTSKMERNELRARDAEARLRIIEAEIAIINNRSKLEALRDAD
jgi:putative heme degradation protein